MKKSIYLSLPIAMRDRDEFALAFTQRVMLETNSTWDVHYWRKNDMYNPRLLENADVVLFHSDNNAFSAHFSDLPIGVKRELETSLKARKDMYLVYKPGNYIGDVHNYNIYEVNFELENRTYRGIPGTANLIWKYLASNAAPVIMNVPIKLVEPKFTLYDGHIDVKRFGLGYVKTKQMLISLAGKRRRKS